MAKKKPSKPVSPAGAATYGDEASSEPMIDTRAAAEGVGKGDKPKGDPAKFWHDEIKAADKREDKWRKRGKKVVDRYRDDRDKESGDRKTNILWSNTELLKGVLFTSVGNPDVRRRYPKKGKDERAARQAALVLERGLGYCKDAYDIEAQLECVVEDHLLPGRGQGWVVYDADLEYAKSEAEPDDSDETLEPEPTGIADQEVRFEHVYWEDYRTSAGRKEADIWWKARRHQYTRDELTKYFPEHAGKIPLNAEVLDSPSTNKEDNETFKRANVWELWDKTKKQRVWVAEEYSFILRKDDDPYKLRAFFPCPPALYGVKTTSSLTPIPEYTLYQDQCEELDQITTRLNRLIDALKRRGVYDSSMEGADNQLSALASAGDNEFLPFKGFAGMMEKGGLKQVFQTEDLAPIMTVVQGLYEQRQNLIQTIYEVTGISDVIRGSSNPNETATAQRIKGQFGSLRIQKRQSRVQNFVRDLFRLKAEIIAEHFTREKLVEMTGVDMPLQAEIDAAKQALQQMQQMQQQAAQQAQAQHAPQGAAPGQMPAPSPLPPMQQQMPPPPMPAPEQIEGWQATAKAVSWEEISSILRSDDRRGYKVDVETDDTARMDEQEEKQSRIEFVQAMEQYMTTAVPGAIAFPPFIPLVKEMAQFMVKGFKAGRPLEEAFEDAFAKLEQSPPSPPGAAPDPVAQAKAKEIEQNMQLAAQKHQGEMASMQGDQALKGLDAQLRQLDVQKGQQEIQRNAQQMDMEFLHGNLDAHATLAEHQRDEQAHQADMAQAHVGLQSTAADQQRQQATHAVSIEGAKADQQHKATVAHSKAAAPAQKANGAQRSVSSPAPAAPPAATSGLQQALMQMAQAITHMAETNAQVLKAVTAPRSVKIVRDAAGRAAGAVQQVMDLGQPAMGNA